MNVLTFIREFWTFSFVPAGAVVGWYFDRKVDLKYSTFRHKSKLFQGESEAKKVEA